MRLFFITTSVLSQAFVVLSQHAEVPFQVASTWDGRCAELSPLSACEEHARRQGLPTDGWAIFYDNEGPKCRRVAVQEICHGIEYIDADTKDKKCCQDASGLTWIDMPAKLAKCCAKDHIWTFDNRGGPTRGGCCPVGAQFINGQCVPNTGPPPPRCPPGTSMQDGTCIPASVPNGGCPVGSEFIDGKCVPLVPPPRCPPGTSMQDGTCIPTSVPNGSCPVGSEFIDGQCIPITDPPPPRCPPGTSTQDGTCIPTSVPNGSCPVGSEFIDGQCVSITDTPPPRCPPGTFMQDGECILTPHGNCPIGTHIQDNQCVPSPGPSGCPQTCGNGHGGIEPSCMCTNYPICGYGKYLGIKYGHCYILSFSDGQQLGAIRENPQYVKGGFFNDIPFKVCNSTTGCSPGKEVEMGESFYLQDQHGLYTDPKSTKGWIDNAHNGDHLGFTHDTNKAGRFMGTPTCAGGECGIQLRGGPVNGGMGFACPMPTPGVTFYNNPKISQKLRFSEVTCDDYEVPLTSGINPAVKY